LTNHHAANSMHTAASWLDQVAVRKYIHSPSLQCVTHAKLYCGGCEAAHSNVGQHMQRQHTSDCPPSLLSLTQHVFDEFVYWLCGSPTVVHSLERLQQQPISSKKTSVTAAVLNLHSLPSSGTARNPGMQAHTPICQEVGKT
jgi:hypothetical protein